MSLPVMIALKMDTLDDADCVGTWYYLADRAEFSSAVGEKIQARIDVGRMNSDPDPILRKLEDIAEEAAELCRAWFTEGTAHCMGNAFDPVSIAMQTQIYK